MSPPAGMDSCPASVPGSLFRSRRTIGPRPCSVKVGRRFIRFDEQFRAMAKLVFKPTQTMNGYLRDLAHELNEDAAPRAVAAS